MGYPFRQAAVLGAIALFPSAFANLIVNPGFETGDFTGWIVVPAEHGSDFGTVFGFGHSGNFGAYFQATQQEHDTIVQVLQTTPGERYEGSFWVNNSGYQNDSLRLIWEGEVFIDLTPMPRTNGWARIPFYDLIAHSDHADFAVQAYDSDSVIYLDDFDLDLAVPEPSTIFVTLAGFLFIGARGRGREKRR